MKVTYIDNSSKQYDASASLLTIPNVKTVNKLYIGDMNSASMVQLQHRSIVCCINCATDLHRYSKEKNVTYVNIDPITDDKSCYKKSYDAIDKYLNEGNVLIIDESGLIQAAAIAIYYVMNKINVSLAKSFSIVTKCRPPIRPRFDLVQYLIDYEKETRKIATVRLGGKHNREIIYDDDNSSTNSKVGSNNSVKKTDDNMFCLIGTGMVVLVLVLLLIILKIVSAL